MIRPYRSKVAFSLGTAVLLAVLTPNTHAQIPSESLLKQIPYRDLGPYRTGAWTVGVAVPATSAHAHRSTIYAALRSGGVWKSDDGGTTFAPVLDAEKIYSMGAIAVAPSNENIIWAGTGDNSATRSAYWGDGVYKSSDAGKTWTNMGLRDTQHIARIVIHPTKPDTLYVAAMGHLATSNEERGIFKTTDGGKSWKKILYIGDTVGAVDIVQNPVHPNTLYAAMYEHQRLPWMIVDGGPGTGLYKTTDGGAHWKELTNGLPKGQMGRIGLDICLTKPRTLYAVYDNHNMRANPRNKYDTINGQVYRTDDAGASWRRANPDDVDVSGKAGYSFNQIRVDPNNPDRVWVTGSDFHYTADGGKTWAAARGDQRQFPTAFGDFRSLWIDPVDSLHMIATSDGGVFQSFDGGKTSANLITIKGGEVYAIDTDRESPYNIYEGLQDHESWKGPSNGWAGNIGIGDWVTTGQGDGMYNRVDPFDSRWVYNTQEFGQLGRYDQKTHERVIVAPKRASGEPLRFNWIAPFTLSPQDSKTIYAGAQVVLRSTDRGDHWEEISPDLTTNDQQKINHVAAGSAVQFCTITTLSASPVKAGVLWVGTDDGKVQLTQDDGKNWTDVTPNIVAAGGPESVWTSRVYASASQPGVAYIAKTGRRKDDFKPYLFKTTDYGAHWTSMTDGLPQWPVNSIVEDSHDVNALFAGTDIGVYVSLDAGAHWTSFQSNMPPAAVTDMVIQPDADDLVVATFGRGTWIANISSIREMTANNLKSNYLFHVAPRAIRHDRAQGNYRFGGDTFPTSPNDPNGLLIYYYLAQDVPSLSITVVDSSGKTVRTLNGPMTVGLHRIGSETFERGRGTRPQAVPAMPPGKYIVTLTAGDTTLKRDAEVLPASTFSY